MSIQMIALDLDRTLLDPDGRMEAGAPEVLAEARRRGVEVTLVTARSWRGTRPYVEALNIRAPVVCLAGAIAIDPVRGEELWRLPVPAPDAALAARLAVKEGFCLGAFLGRLGLSAVATPAWPERPGGLPASFRSVPNLEACVLADPPLRMVALDRRAATALVAGAERFRESEVQPFEQDTPGEGAYLLARGVSKGEGLVRLCCHLGVAPDRVFAMGDDLPDLSMLRVAGLSAAMPQSPPELLAVAGYVPERDDPHPVTTAIRQLVLEEGTV